MEIKMLDLKFNILYIKYVYINTYIHNKMENGLHFFVLFDNDDGVNQRSFC